ncbi:MAG: hypothetical protein AAFX94_01860 [Myxococcota bacterium]
MTTWDANLDRRQRGWLVWATVQSVGDAQGLWRFSDVEGWSLAAGEGTWKPYLSEFPDLLSERVPFFEGGAVASGAGIDLAIVDGRGELTDLLQPDSGPSAQLTTAITDADTTLGLTELPAGVSDGELLWLGSEVVRVESQTAGPPASVTVTRAQLGTVGTAHRAGVELFARPRLLESREIKVYLAPLNATSDSEARLVGSYVLEDVALDDSHATWLLSGGARDQFLDRRCPRAARTVTVTRSTPARGASPGFLDVGAEGPNEEDFGGTGEVRVVLGHPESDELTVWRNIRGLHFLYDADNGGRAHAGTAQDELPQVGREMRRVLSVANGDFRATLATTATAARTSPAFVAVSSWVEVLLCVLLSPALEDEPATNYDPTGTNWAGRNFSGLLPGYGVGVPWAEVDFDSFQRVAVSTASFPVPWFVLGPESASFSDVVSGLLSFAGAFLVRSRGQLRLVAPEVSLIGASPEFSIDRSTLHVRPGAKLPAVQTKRTRLPNTEIAFKLGPQEVERSVALGDLPEIFDPRDLYIFEGKPRVVEAPFLDPAGVTWADQGVRYLRRLVTSRTELQCDLDATFIDMALGESAAIDLPGVPNFRGQRGLVGNGQLAELEVTADERRGVYAKAKVFVAPPFQVGRISASGDIIAVDGNRATIECNTYTASDAPAGLPSTDSASFRVGDVVRQVDAAGTDTGGGTQIVTAAGELVALSFTPAQQVNGAGSVITAPPSATAYLQVHVFGTNETLSDATTSAAYGGVSPTLTDQNLHRFAFGPTRGYQYSYLWAAADIAGASGNTLTVISGLADVMTLIRWVDGDLNTTPGLITTGGASKGGPSWSGQNGFVLTASNPGVLREGALWLGAFMAEGPFTMTYTEGQKTTDGPFFPAGATYVVETAFALKLGTNPDRIDGTGSGDTGNFGDQGNTGGLVYDRNTDVTGAGCFVVLDGDFAGNLAVGNTLIYADHGEAAAQQTDAYVFTDQGWVFG